MGAYVSRSQCQSQYNIIINCDFNFSLPEAKKFIGNYTYGTVPPDGDVAGIGIVSMFIGVTSVALSLSAIDAIWRFFKTMEWKTRLTMEDKIKKSKRSCGGISINELLESLVVSCSDQQVFTGGAYALTLRYWKGCSITAYHYSIVANMMLLTCATHLLSIAIVRNYWRYPWLAILRIIIVTGVFTFTGLLLSNMQATGGVAFPSGIPPQNTTDSGYLGLAACYQAGVANFAKNVEDSVKDGESAKKAFIFTTVGSNRIEGWNFYLITLICYLGAIIVEVVRFVQRRPRTKAYLRSCLGIKSSGSNPWVLKIARFIYGAWILGCVGTSGVTIGFEAKYMMDLRAWVKKSGWLKKDEWGNSAEDDGTSFGQLVPVFLGLLTLFTFAQSISEMGSRSRRSRPGIDDDGELSIRRYKTLPQDPIAMGDVTPMAMSNGQMQSPDSNSEPHRSSTVPVRPTFHDRNSRESGAALLGGSVESPYSLSSPMSSTPVFPTTSRHSQMTSYSSYFPVEQTTSPFSPSTQRSSIPRRPVGFSPDVSAQTPTLYSHRSVE